MYDGVLSLELPKVVEIVGFADNVVLMVKGETQEEIEMLAARQLVWSKIAHRKT